MVSALAGTLKGVKNGLITEMPTNVRFGSLADMCSALGDVR